MVDMCVIADIDECNGGLDQCSSDGVCTDMEPAEGYLGYTCQCKEGYTGDGFTCIGNY